MGSLRATLLRSLATAAVACTPKPVAVTGTTTIKGSLSLPAAQKGKTFTVFVTKDSAGKDVVGKTTGTLGASSYVDYKIEKLPKGKYFLFATVDVNGDGDTDAAMDEGDYEGFFESDEDAPTAANAEIPADGEVAFDLSLSKLNPDAYPDVRGVVTLSKDATGKFYYVFIDDDTDWDNGFVDFDAGLADGSSISYSMKNVQPGADYFVYTWVDMDGDEEDSIGDLQGFFHGAGGLPPDSRGTSNFDLGAARDEQEADFAAEEVKNSVTGKVEFIEDLTEEKTIWVYIDTDNNPVNGAVKTTTGKVTDGKRFDFKESGLAAGKYYLYTIVDMDDSGGPSAGDVVCGTNSCSSGYIGASRITVEAEGDSKESILAAVSKNYITGTVTLPQAALGKTVEVAFVGNNNPMTVDFSALSFKATSTGATFGVFSVSSSGSRYLLAYVGDRTNGPRTGDFIGYSGSTNGTPTTVKINNTGDQTFDVPNMVAITNVLKGKATFPLNPPEAHKLVIYLDTDNDPANGETATLTDLAASTDRKYAFYNLDAGDYFLRAWVDMNDNDSDDAGDWNGDSTVTVDASGDVSHDFSLTAAAR